MDQGDGCRTRADDNKSAGADGEVWPMTTLEGKTVLVTGATGFIGSYLVNRLRRDKEINLLLLSRKQVSGDGGKGLWLISSLDKLLRDTWQKAGVNHIDDIFHL